MNNEEKIEVLKTDLRSIERDPTYLDYVKLVTILAEGEQLFKRREFKIKQLNELSKVEEKRPADEVIEDLGANLDAFEDEQAVIEEQRQSVPVPPRPVQRVVPQQAQQVQQQVVQQVPKKVPIQEKVKEVLKYSNEELGIGDDIDLDFDV